ncbi:retropepsin-like aspartic protease [uncultured Erythrobacter sp.]|uniref:retropepsin-like aspartic protease n=1 Tax=uncultured Erythrobacter sp. TaxID=263913 RepID=UPI0026020A4B|nr:retropepsin-like aspartic protease [uncultured Erythrobacter sp.]
MVRLVSLLALACTALAVQAVQASESSSTPSPPTTANTFEVDFLHSGSPELMPVDLSKGVVFFKALVNGQEVWILLDNGAANTVIDTSLAEAVGSDLTVLQNGIRAPSGQLETRVARQINLNIPTQIEFTADLYAVDFEPISARIGRRIGLVLGNDVLSNLTYVVDPQFSRVLFVPSGTMNLSGGNIQNLTMVNGVIDTLVDGKPARLKLDLGSNHQLTIFEHSWENFFSDNVGVERTMSADATGNVRASEVRQNTRLDVGRFSAIVRTTRLDHPDDSIDGHIGFPYFLDKLVVVDEAAGKLTIVQR